MKYPCKYCDAKYSSPITLAAHEGICANNPARKSIYQTILDKCFEALKRCDFDGIVPVEYRTNQLEYYCEIKGRKRFVYIICLTARTKGDRIEMNLANYFDCLEHDLEQMIWDELHPEVE